MKLATMCSGIGAPEVAAKQLGWECLWSAEVDPKASAVLAHHHPESINLGDITKIDGRELEKPDVLVFGTPCQSFSVAGKRAGMDDARGVLAFVALGIVGRVRPTWFILENVPGLLSSSAGRDFGAFLRAVDDLGYSGAWASPDAQFFNLAQRRERVFFVGHIGDWRYPASVLSQFSRLCGHPAPSREAGERVAPAVAVGPPFSRTGNERVECEALVTHAIGIDGEMNATEEMMGTLRSHQSGGYEGAMVAHTLTKRYDSSEDGCGRGVPLVAGCLSPGAHPGGFNGQDAYDDKLIVFDPNQVTSPGNYSNPKAGDPCHPLVSAAPPILCDAIGFHSRQDPICASVSLPLEAKGGRAVAFSNPAAGARGMAIGEKSPPVKGGSGGNMVPLLHHRMSVRRLTPRECERLQGFPDDFTLIPYKGKPMADGPRYKMIGNSMAVKVLKWLLERIEAVENMPLLKPASIPHSAHGGKID